MLTRMSDLAVINCFRLFTSSSYKRRVEEQVKVVACPATHWVVEGGLYLVVANWDNYGTLCSRV